MECDKLAAGVRRCNQRLEELELLLRRKATPRRRRPCRTFCNIPQCVMTTYREDWVAPGNEYPHHTTRDCRAPG